MSRLGVRCALIIACLLVPLTSLAQSSGTVVLHSPFYTTITTAVNDALRQKADVAGWVSARALGVVADGVTSDDVPLGAAIAACSAVGTKLLLPPGKILLTGAGLAAITLKDCAIEGVGEMAGGTSTHSWGTTILLTSTTVPPFTISSNFSLSGVNFYWPNQLNGTTVYPPLFTMKNGSQVWFMDHINVINGYEGIVSGEDTFGTGAWYISNSWLFTLRDTFRLPYVGDSVHLSGVVFDPGTWLQICSFAPACLSAVDARQNTAFDVIDTLNLSMDNVHFFAYDYVFKVATGGTVGITSANFMFDGVTTLIDASASGAVWGPGNIVRGAGDCHRYNYATDTNTGHAPCFKMGANGLALDGLFASASGSIVESTSGNVSMLNSAFSMGEAADGGDYYVVHTTLNTGGLVIELKNNVFAGRPSSTKTHGVKTDVAASRMIVQNNHFEYFNDDLDVQSAPTTIISGNWSIATQGTESIVSASLASGGNGVVYEGNYLDKPPVSTIGGCTTGASVSGAFSGFLTVCSTNPTSTFTLTLPWTPLGSGAGTCIFQDSLGVPLTSGPSALVWTITSVGAADLHGHNIWFNCPGRQ